MRTFIARPAAGAVVASGSVAHIGTRSAMVNNVGLLCLIIDSGGGSAVSGRVRLQKAAYFCQYLGWPLRDYRLHYCGPYSQTLAETVVDAESACPGPAPPDMRAAAGAGRRARPRGASPFPPRSCAAGGGEGRPPLTLPMAMRAGGGIAAAADRKEGLPGRAGRKVTKCLLDAGGRLCPSLPGDGPAARAILDSIGPSGPAWKMSDLAEAAHEECHSDMPVDGIPVAAAARGPEICDSCIRDGQIDLYANNGAAAAHGGHAAHVPCRRLAKGLDARRLSRGAAAAHLHVPAGGAAETVDSAGRRDEYGFDLATIGAAAGGGAASPWRQAGALGALEVRFRMSGAGGGRSAGGGGAHG